MIIASKKIHSLSITNLREFTVAFMVFATVIDMGGGLYMKYLSYLLGVIMLFYLRKLEIDRRGFLIVMILYVVGPFFASIIGIINDAELNSLLIQITPFVPAIILYFLLTKYNIKIFFTSFIGAALIISLLTIFIYLLFIFSPTLKLIITAFMDSHNMGFFGNKDIEGSFFPNVYFKSVLFLNFAFVLTLYKHENLKSLIIFCGILLSFSKSATIFAIISWFVMYGNILSYRKNQLLINTKYLLILSLTWLAVITLLVYYSNELTIFYDYFYNALTGKADTTIVRVKHFESVLNLFSEHPLFMIFGQGVGTSFFSSGFGYMTDNIEIDHLNTIRKFGLIWSLIFYSFIFWEIITLYKSQNKGYRAIGLAYLTTFILVGTNPLLINPLFLMITIVVYKLIISAKRNTYDISVHDNI